MTRAKSLAGVLLMFALYSLYQILALSDMVITHATRKQQHIILFISIMVVYFAGSLLLKKVKPLWMLQLWHLFHLLLIPLIVIAGIADWSIGGLPKGWRHFAQTIAETLVSPVLFTCIILLQFAFGNITTSNKS